MSLSELHPFIATEIERVPEDAGVFVLFQIQIPIHADQARNLRQHLLRAKKEFPNASHFAVEPGKYGQETTRRVENLRNDLRLVRAKGFVGTPERASR